MKHFFMGMAICSVLGLVGGPTWAQPGGSERDKRVAEIQKEIADLRARIATLEAELAKLQPPDRVADVEPLHVLKGHSGEIQALYFSPDSTELFSVAEDGCLKWEVVSGKQKEKIGPPPGENFRLAGFSLDTGTVVLVTAEAGGAVYFEISRHGGSAGRVPADPFSCSSLAVSPDGKSLAAVLKDERSRSLVFWDIEEERGKVRNSVQTNAAKVQYSPDGKYLVLCGDGAVVVWKATTLKPIDRKPLDKKVGSLAIDPKSKTLAIVTDEKTVRLVGLLDGEEKVALEAHAEPLQCVAFSPDGKYVAAGSTDHTALLWDAETGKKVATVEAHANEVMSVAFSPDGKTLATGSKDQTVKLWSVEKLLGK